MTPAPSASNLPARRDAEPQDDYESVDAVPVLDGPREVQAVSVAPLARQAAAVAATSFLAGATAIVLVRGRRARRHRIKLRGGRRRGQKVVSSHSFLVDVHVLGR